jgi:hypothetical protein
MKKLISIVILFSILCFSIEAKAQNSSFDTFWTKFKDAVMKDDKQTLSGMAKYPLSMPYGVKSVKNKTDFIKRYKTIFDGQLKGFPIDTAKKCFAGAKPEKEEGSSAYIVPCNEVVIFRFVKTSSGWKLSGVDNINE